MRRFSREDEHDCDCSALEHVLATVPSVKRMVMGHTIQTVGINGVCDDKGIRIDVGLSKGCGDGLPEVLEISGNSGLRILTANPLYQNKGAFDVGKEQGLGVLLGEHGGAPRPVEDVASRVTFVFEFLSFLFHALRLVHLFFAVVVVMTIIVVPVFDIAHVRFKIWQIKEFVLVCCMTPGARLRSAHMRPAHGYAQRMCARSRRTLGVA
ncbi:hypothetical protein Fmac_029102 [Flemingia macrophylla]|uniref:Uncharacterized protein n=1 Tax=Flemingia macrophylla TaxID=520843 RepID=A0ABD1L9X2_9FABA